MKREFPRLCRGGSKTLRIPGVCPGFGFSAFAFVLAVAFNGCEKAPLRGQQP